MSRDGSRRLWISRRVVADGGAMTTLALEFRTGRETGDFSFLADEFPLRRIDPISGHTDAVLTLGQQAEELAADSVDMVLAYCACAALGAHVAALSGAPLILIDADVVTPEAIRRDTAALCTWLNAPPSEDPEAAFAHARDDLAALQGGDEMAYGIVDELFARYRAWLRFLAASAAAPPAAVASQITAIAGKPLPDLGILLVDPTRVELHPVASDSATLESPDVRSLLRGRLSSSSSSTT